MYVYKKNTMAPTFVEPEEEPQIKLGYKYDNEKYTENIERGNPVYNICFTVNNYTEKHIEYFECLNYKYLIMAEEYGSKTGTPHIQGFISLDINHKKRLQTLSRQLKKFAGTGCWMAACRGSPLDNMIYCKKGGNIIKEDGNVKLCGKGSRERKLQDLQALIDGGMSMQQLAKENFNLYIQYGKRLEQYKKLQSENQFTEYQRNRYTDGVYIYGKTGTQKSTLLKKFIQKYYDKSKVANLRKTENGFWQGGYHNQPLVVLDDAKTIMYNDLLDLINIKSHVLNIKNGERQFNSRMVIMIDSNDFDTRFGGFNVEIDGVLQTEQKADYEISRRFKKFNFENMDEKKELFKYLKCKLTEYDNDNTDDIPVEDDIEEFELCE